MFMRRQPRTYDEQGMAEMRKRQDSVVVKAGSSRPYKSQVKYGVESFNKLRNHLLVEGIGKAIIHKGFVENV